MTSTVNYPDFVVSRLGSTSSTQVILGLGVIYFCEFLKIHLGSVLYGGLRTILKALLPNIGRSEGFRTAEELIDLSIAAEALKEEKEKYKTVLEDTKSSKGSENDIYMLKTHGYNKYRFVSRGFIKRNKLRTSED